MDERCENVQSVLIIDPALRSSAGHHFNFIKALTEIVESAGWTTRVLASLWIDEKVKFGLGATGCFHQTIYHRKNWTQLAFRRHSFAFSEILRRQIVRWETLPNVVIFPCCDQVQYDGFAKLVAELKLPWAPIVLAWHMFPPRMDLELEDFGSAPQQQEYKTAFRNIRSALGNRGALYIVSETESLAAVYRDLSALPVTVLRSPSILEHYIEAGKEKFKDPIHIVVTGHAKASKGYDLLSMALKHVLRKRPNLSITIHGTVAETDNPSAMIKAFDLMREAIPSATLSTDALDMESYYNLLRSADLLLLPYDPKVYKNKGSGIFQESITLGIPTIVPLACEFAAEAIKEHRAIGIKHHTPSAICEAVISAVDDYAQLEAKTRSYALHLNEKKNPRTFILGILEGSKSADVLGQRETFWRSMWHNIKYFTAAIASLIP